MLHGTMTDKLVRTVRAKYMQVMYKMSASDDEQQG